MSLRVRMEGALEVLEAAVPTVEAARAALDARYPTSDDVNALRAAHEQWPNIETALARVRREQGAEKLVAKIDSLSRKIHKRVGGERAAVFTAALAKIPRGTLPPAPTETKLDAALVDDELLSFGIFTAAFFVSFALKWSPTRGFTISKRVHVLTASTATRSSLKRAV